MKRFLATIFACAALFCAQTATFGMSYTYADYVKLYPEVPDDQNAAVILTKGFAEMKLDGLLHSPDLPFLGQAEVPLGSGPLSSKMLIKMKDCLQRNEAAFNHFEQATNYQRSHYPALVLSHGQIVPFNPTTDNLARIGLPQSTKAQNAEKLLAVRALWEASKREEKEAAATLITGFSVARSLEQDPALISQTIRVTCIKYIAKSFEQTLNRLPLSARTLKSLEPVIAATEARESSGTNFARALAGQQIILWQVFDLSLEEQAREIPGSLSDDEKIARLKANAKEEDRQFFMETFDILKSSWNQPYPARLKFLEICNTRDVAATNKNFLLSFSHLPWITRSCSAEAQSVAYLRLMQTAIGLEYYRLSHHGVYPQFLSDLVPQFLPAIPQDPFNGKPFRYRKLGSGYAVSSVGKDDKRLFSVDENTSSPTTEISLKVINAPKRSHAETKSGDQ